MRTITILEKFHPKLLKIIGKKAVKMKTSMRRILIWLSFIIILVLEETEAGTGFDMYFDNITCSSVDPEGYIKKLSCSLSKSVKRRTFSLELQVTKDLHNFLFNMVVILPRKNNPDFILLNMTNVEGCKVLANKNQSPFMRIGMETLTHYGNIPQRCPLQKDVVYYIRGFRIDMNVLPLFTFEAEMLTWFDVIVDNSKIIHGFLRSFVTAKRMKAPKLK